jgi:hypothetical protein
MLGAVRTFDILSHPIVTVQSFGWRTFFRALAAGRNDTFAALLRKDIPRNPRLGEPPAVFERCIGLELQAMRIYDRFAEQFPASLSVSAFFGELAAQEQHHAELLEVCRAAACRRGWKPDHLHAWHEYLPLLEQQMREVSASLDAIRSVEDALHTAIRMELSEINLVMLAVMKATDSAFVRKLRAFREAAKDHIAFICLRVPTLAHGLAPECRELRAKFHLH